MMNKGNENEDHDGTQTMENGAVESLPPGAEWRGNLLSRRS